MADHLELNHDSPGVQRLVQDNVLWLRDLFCNLFPEMFTMDTSLSQMQIRLCASLKLYDGQPATVSALAVELDRPRSTVQKTLDKLVENGWFKYIRDPDDARHRLVTLTKKGWDQMRDFERLVVEQRLRTYLRVYPILVELGLPVLPVGNGALVADLREVLDKHGVESSKTK